MVSGFATAQQLKIGYVNFASADAGFAAGDHSKEAVLQEEFAPRSGRLLALQAELPGKQEQIQRDLDVMGPDERRNAENDLRRDEREIKRQQQELQEDANLRQNEAIAKIAG